MLVFFDESFRQGIRGHQFGVLWGIAIPEELQADVAQDIHYMKRNSFGEEFARTRELKGAKLLKRRNFRPEAGARGRASVEFVRDTMRYIVRKRLVTFGIVCFDTRLRTFKCDEPDRLDPTYRALFQRLDNYMTREFPGKRAKLIFDDVDYATNANRARAITNFFNRSPVGRGYDTIIRTPFFAVSQAENVGLQLADIVTTVAAIRFEGDRQNQAMWRELHASLYRYQLGSLNHTTMKVFRERQ